MTFSQKHLNALSDYLHDSDIYISSIRFDNGEVTFRLNRIYYEDPLEKRWFFFYPITKYKRTLTTVTVSPALSFSLNWKDEAFVKDKTHLLFNLSFDSQRILKIVSTFVDIDIETSQGFTFSLQDTGEITKGYEVAEKGFWSRRDKAFCDEIRKLSDVHVG